MINLFNIPNYTIDTSKFNHLINGDIVDQFTEEFCRYTKYQYGCPVNSATSAIFLLAKIFNRGTYTIPTMIPPVVPNAIMTAGADFIFTDDTKWIGKSYKLYENEIEGVTIIDSAQEVEKNIYYSIKTETTIAIYSFYPTKPVGSCDGGMICSNNKNLIEYLKVISNNGVIQNHNNSWNRNTILPGYKMYMNSIQAYIAMKNLYNLDYKKQKLTDVATYYCSWFPYDCVKCNNSKHLFTISIENRDEFINKMKEKNITCGIHYECAHKNPIYNKTYQRLIESEYKSKHIVSIPFHEELTHQELEYIVKCIKSIGLTT